MKKKIFKTAGFRVTMVKEKLTNENEYAISANPFSLEAQMSRLPKKTVLKLSASCSKKLSNQHESMKISLKQFGVCLIRNHKATKKIL